VELVESMAPRADSVQAAALTYSRLGCLAELEADLPAAARWHSEAVREIAGEAIPHQQAIAAVAEGVAALAAARGEYERAAELLGTAHALHGCSDERSPEVRRASAAIAAALDPGTAERAYARGRRVPVDQVLSSLLLF
jgi:hypothetical protein